MSEDKTPDGRELVKQIVGEIAALEYAGDVKAIAALIIDGDGDVRVMTAFSEGTKLAIIGGTLVMQRHLMDHVVPFTKPAKI